MIDVQKTISSTIEEYINKLRFVGKDNPKAFKKVISLVIMDDVYDWSQYLGVKLEIIDKLKNNRIHYIMNNCELLKQREPLPVESQAYTNVNTPQSNMTWRRVWDALEVVSAGTVIETTDLQPWELDPTCPIQLVYFSNSGLNKKGKPQDIKIQNLTICEKMNVYVNRDDNTVWILDNMTNLWKQITSGEGLSEEEVLELIKNNKPGLKVTQGSTEISHSIGYNEEETPNEFTETVNINVADVNEIGGIL